MNDGSASFEASPPGSPRTTGGQLRWAPPSAEELQRMLPQYAIESLIGCGGMGAVYKGQQLSLERPVAIKILPPAIEQDDPAYAERFRNEARIMGRLNHPAIVSVYDFGRTSEGQLYFVMEFIDGTDVQQLLATQGRLSAAHALAVTAHVCDALDYAHKLGVVHRDIKPSNILIDHDGRVKVADFGLAKWSGSGTTSGLTQTGMAMGTPDFVAPETLAYGMEVDGRADLYAVGVMLYLMLTGDLPRGMFKMPSQKVAGIDPRFDGIIKRSLENDRTERYQTSHEFRRDLDVILTTPLAKSGQPSSAALPKQQVEKARQAPLPARRAAAAPAPHPAEEEAPRKASSLPYALAAVIILLVGGYAIIHSVQSPSTPASAAAPSPKEATPLAIAPTPPAPETRPQTSVPAPSQTQTQTSPKALTSQPASPPVPVPLPERLPQRLPESELHLIEEGPGGLSGSGKHVVLIAGDDEYRSEEVMPMLARLLASRFGFKCTVLFPLNADGTVNPERVEHLSDDQSLDRADALVLMLRQRNWTPSIKQSFTNAIARGLPIVALRNSSKAFVPQDVALKDFGRQVLGQEWLGNWGAPRTEATRGIIEPQEQNNEILQGVKDLFCLTNTFEANLPTDARVLVRGQVLNGLKPTSPPITRFQQPQGGGKAQNVNEPMMPVAWTRICTNASGRQNRIFATTLGSAEDFKNADLRRLVINAVLRSLDLPVPAEADVNLGEAYRPSSSGLGDYRKGRSPMQHKLSAIPAPAPMRSARPIPPSLAIPPAGQVQNRLAQLDSEFQADYDRLVNALYDQHIAFLGKNYQAALDRGISDYLRSGKRELQEAFRTEKQRFITHRFMPSIDPNGLPQPIIELREKYRKAATELERQRDATALPLYKDYLIRLDWLNDSLMRAGRRDEAAITRLRLDDVTGRRSRRASNAGGATALKPLS